MSDDNSLYPTYEESVKFRAEVERFMSEIKPIIYGKLKKEVEDMLEQVFEQVFNNMFDATIENLEFDAFSSVRDRILDGLRDYSTAKNYRDYYFKDVRKKMVEENKEEIINDRIKDLEKIIEEKEDQIRYLRVYR